MKTQFLAVTGASILAFLASASVAHAQSQDASKKNMDASKKKIENITTYGAVQTSTGPAKGYTGTYTANPPKRKTDLQIAPPPSPATPKNPNGGWRGPTNPTPVRVQQSTTTYHAPVSTTTYHAPVSTTTYRAASSPPARAVTGSAPPTRSVSSSPPQRTTTTTTTSTKKP